jgi:hypothetical protein
MMLPAESMRTKTAGFIIHPMGTWNSDFSYAFLKNSECVCPEPIGTLFWQTL